MRTTRSIVAALAGLAVASIFAVLLAGPAGAQASPCAPGQPSGRPPGQPPSAPGQPGDRPPYPPGKCQLALSQSAAARGATFTATGQGFVPGETVRFSMGSSVLASAVADAAGTVTAALTVPDDAVIGRTEVVAAAPSQELSAGFEVLGAAASRDQARADTTAAVVAKGSSLARTGAYIAASVLAGLALIAVGTFLVVGARRRRGLAAA